MEKQLIGITKYELKTKWWHRLANVLIYGIPIVVFLVLFFYEQKKINDRIHLLYTSDVNKMSYSEVQDTYTHPFFIEHFASFASAIFLFLFLLFFYRKIVLYVSHGGIINQKQGSNDKE